ncbi:MAG: cation transporter [Bacteroidetes bacterium]|nr:cation transporter [Bacteroidota bacterium]
MTHHLHSNGHHHHHRPDSVNRIFIIGIILNVTFVIIEAVAGLWIGSLSLLTDAGHNLTDVVSLVLVVIANQLAQKKATKEFTYGFGKTTVLVALINAITLLVMVGAIGWEAILRFENPQPIQGQTIAWVALAGIVVNGITALLFFKGSDKDLNRRGAFLHMAADALVSLGVLVSGVVIFYTSWYWVDATVALVNGLIITTGSWRLLKDSWRLSLDGVPNGINMEAIKKYLLSITGVAGLHDLHIWAMSTNVTALTVHLVVPADMEPLKLSKINAELHTKFNIDHTTIQIEKPSDKECEQRC